MGSSQPGAKAWAALVTRENYVPGLLALHRTLASVSDYPLVVLATPSLPEKHRALIKRRGMQLYDIPPLAPQGHAGFDAKFERFADTWTKLQAFRVPGYDRLVLIDADTIFLRGMDELFTMDLPEDWIAAAPACTCNPFKFAHYPNDWIPANCSFTHQPNPTALDNVPQPSLDAPRIAHLLNSGVVVLHPRPALMEELEEHLRTSPTVATAQFPDQEVLADVFRGRWRVLPWWANALKTLRAVHKPLWLDKEVRLLHYILEKPWSKLPATSVVPYSPARSSSDGKPGLPSALGTMVASAGPQESLTDYDTVHAWWWAVYDDVLHGLKEEEPDMWEEVDKWVAH
ncbi:hypothetical protein CspeluHIS016_0200260 [Cutaneotrichosporon spelunceum]|uniref:Nucleotide-diphospho-sugar transferase n=1 Tax=Cutaneotrichosporon spelunceum TaxID=1672016 RepID=A0AAD3TRB1_9TREE|nr:hypothetical protein CspeluHIS016_0200260 [Cutaneotrichosporon spelunceum]